MRTRVLGVLIALALVVAALMVLGCTEEASTTTVPTATGGSDTTTAPDSTQTTVAPETEVKVTQWDIPFLVFLSGPYGGFGEQMKWSVEQAVVAMNDAGGIAGKPVNVTYNDTGLDPAKASAEMSKVVEDSLTIMGPVAAVEAKAAMPLAVENEMMVMSVATGTDITKEFAPYLVSFIAPTEVAVPPVVEEWVKLNPGIKSVVQFTWPLDPTWMQMAGVHTATLEKLGIQSTDVEVGEGVDMGAVAVKALGQEPDAYIITVGPVEAGKIAQELDKRGVTDHSKILVFMTADDPALFETGGAAEWRLYLQPTRPAWDQSTVASTAEGLRRGDRYSARRHGAHVLL